jgi:hypothetical protein
MAAAILLPARLGVFSAKRFFFAEAGGGDACGRNSQ